MLSKLPIQQTDIAGVELLFLDDWSLSGTHCFRTLLCYLTNEGKYPLSKDLAWPEIKAHFTVIVGIASEGLADVLAENMEETPGTSLGVHSGTTIAAFTKQGQRYPGISILQNWAKSSEDDFPNGYNDICSYTCFPVHLEYKIPHFVTSYSAIYQAARRTLNREFMEAVRAKWALD